MYVTPFLVDSSCEGSPWLPPTEHKGVGRLSERAEVSSIPPSVASPFSSFLSSII